MSDTEPEVVPEVVPDNVPVAPEVEPTAPAEPEEPAPLVTDGEPDVTVEPDPFPVIEKTEPNAVEKIVGKWEGRVAARRRIRHERAANRENN